MKNFFSIASLFLLISCQKEFNSPEQADNEVTSKGLKDGRWVEYILSERDIVSGEIELSNDTIENKNYIGYRLIEYEDGYPKDKIREFYKTGTTSSYKIKLNEPSRLDKFPEEKIIDSLFYFYNNYSKKILYQKDSIYFEKQFIDSITKKTTKREILIFYKNIPSERQKILDEIDWEFFKKYFPEHYEKFNEPNLFLVKRSYDITLNNGKLDTVRSLDFSELNNILIEAKKIINIGKAEIYGKLIKCSCCDKKFYEKKGWEFANGRAKEIQPNFYFKDPKWRNMQDETMKVAKELESFLKIFGINQHYYCSMKCAVQCGPYE